MIASPFYTSSVVAAVEELWRLHTRSGRYTVDKIATAAHDGWSDQVIEVGPYSLTQ